MIGEACRLQYQADLDPLENVGTLSQMRFREAQSTYIAIFGHENHNIAPK